MIQFTDKEIEVLTKIQSIFDTLCYLFTDKTLVNDDNDEEDDFSEEFTTEESALISAIIDLQEPDETWSAESIIKIYRNPVCRSILFKKGMTKNDDCYLYQIYLEYFNANEVDNFELLLY